MRDFNLPRVSHFVWVEFIFPMSTIKIKLEHQITWQLRKCTCMILALPATFNQLYHGNLLFNLFKNWAKIFVYPMFTQIFKKIEQKLRKCTCMILALPATFNQLCHGYFWFNLFKSLGEHWLGKDLCSQEKSRSKLNVAVIQLIESRRKSQNHACAFPQLPCDLVLQFYFVWCSLER
eukprot:sb/3471859/